MAEEEPSGLRLEVTRFVVEGDNPLPEEETERILAPFLGEHSEIEGIEAAADTLQQAIQAKGDPFYRVIVPAQKPAGGVVLLSVVRYALGSVSVTGNRHFSNANILESVPALRSGETVDMRSVSRSLAIANENPVKRAQVILRESEKPDAIDAEVKVQDSAPQQVFLGISNTGTPETGEWRASVGYQNANLFNRDHVLTASFTTSPDHVSDVQQYGLFYSIPLYALGDSLSAYFVYSSVDQGTVANSFQVSGAGQFYGARYTHLLDKNQDYRQRLVVGLDQQLFTNNASFEGAPVPGIADVGAAPLSLRYEGAWEPAWGTAGFFIEGVHNLQIGSDNNEAAYEVNRPGADPDWNLARFGAEARYRLPKDWSLRGVFVGQFAGQPLIPGVQFGMGGATSVRGFRERAVSGDNGYQMSVELWLAPLKEKPIPGSLWLLAFVDAGYRHFYDPTPEGQNSDVTIASLGVGARWQWKGLNVAADVALVLDGCTTGCAEPGTAFYMPAGRVGADLSVFFRF